MERLVITYTTGTGTIPYLVPKKSSLNGKRDDKIRTISSEFFRSKSHTLRAFAKIKTHTMRLHFILAVFVLAMVSVLAPLFASAENDQCNGFLDNCAQNCGGHVNEKKTLCKTCLLYTSPSPRDS